MNMTITNVDIGTVLLNDAEFEDATMTVASAATTYDMGTILGRKILDDAVTVVDGTNTGNGTVTAATVAAGQIIPKVGAYSFVNTAVVTNGGVFDLLDPDGVQVASGISLTVGAGATTVVNAGGLTFTVTDGSTDFVIGDSFALTTTANGNMVVFEKDGAGGAQIPLAILTYEIQTVTVTSLVIRAGIKGTYKKERLVIHSDGDDSNVDSIVRDQLRDYGLVATNVFELNDLDNQ